MPSRVSNFELHRLTHLLLQLINSTAHPRLLGFLIDTYKSVLITPQLPGSKPSLAREKVLVLDT